MLTFMFVKYWKQANVNQYTNFIKKFTIKLKARNLNENVKCGSSAFIGIRSKIWNRLAAMHILK